MKPHHEIWEITRTARGKTTVEASGPLSKMRDRLRQLRSSTQGGRVSGRDNRKYSVVYALRRQVVDASA